MNKKVAIICASWSKPVVDSGKDAFIAALEEKGSARDAMDVVYVPGSLEIPFVGKKLLNAGYDLAVGIGLIVNGGIYRHEFVAQAVVDGIVNVGLETGKPFLSVAISPQKFDESSAEDEKWFIDHFVIKGQEAAEAAEQMLAFVSDPDAVKQAA